MKKWLLAFTATICITSTAQAASVTSVLDRISSPTYTEHITTDERQTLCLALNVYHEARGSTRQDMAGVAWVTKNRARYSGKTYCQTIWEPGQYSWTTRSANSLVPREMAAWHRVVGISHQVMQGEIRDPTNGANTFYNSRLGIPRWTANGTGRITIGAHTYVRIRNR